MKATLDISTVQEFDARPRGMDVADASKQVSGEVLEVVIWFAMRLQAHCPKNLNETSTARGGAVPASTTCRDLVTLSLTEVNQHIHQRMML